MKTFALALLLFVATTVVAQKQDPVGLTPTAEDAEDIGKKRSFSPYAGRNFPTDVYWGDTHLHTRNSLDARGFGVIIGPDEAFRIARGEDDAAKQRFGLLRWMGFASVLL